MNSTNPALNDVQHAINEAMRAHWPGTARWALGLIVGVNLITSGLAITMAALAGRSLVAR